MPGRRPTVLLTWLRRRAMSFVHAGRGVVLLLLTQQNFRIHFGAAICAVALGLFFGISGVEWLVLVVAITVVVTTEAFNTALEKMVDLRQPDRHLAARDTKDLSAAAVLLASIGALVVGVILFGPRLMRLVAG
jgi:diacylglycerol kinase